MIRPAEARDAAALAALWAPWIRDTSITFNAQVKTAEDVAEMIATRQAAGHGFFLEEEGALLGFATYGQFRAGLGYARSMEHTIVLSPQARGRGVGRRLMAEVEAHAKAGGAHQMIAGCSGENPEAIAFHEGLGYREVGRVPEAGFKFGRYMDLVLLAKRL